MRSAVIAWGVYARGCDEVDAFARACVGCHDSQTHSVALIDTPRVTDNASYGAWRCASATYTFQSEQVALPPHSAGWPVLARKAGALAAPVVPASDLRYWPRTQALFRQLTAAVPMATWYIKLDIDVFLNLHRVRSMLLSSLKPHHVQPPDYIGKGMRVFNYKNEPLT